MSQPHQQNWVGNINAGAVSLGSGNAQGNFYVADSGDKARELIEDLCRHGLAGSPTEEAARELEGELRKSHPDEGRVRKLLDRIAEDARGIGAILATVEAIRGMMG